MATDSWYVDADDGDNMTGDGTSGNPYQTIQKVLDVKTINSDGTDIFLLAGTTADYTVPTTTGLDPGSFGAPSRTQRARIIGWDGVTEYQAESTLAVIDVADQRLMSGTRNYWSLANVHVKGDGTDYAIWAGDGWAFFNCEFSNYGTDVGTKIMVYTANKTVCVNCYFHDSQNYWFRGLAESICARCLFVQQVDESYANNYYLQCSILVENVFVQSDTGNHQVTQNLPEMGLHLGNTYINSAGGGTGNAMFLSSSFWGQNYVIMDNVCQGWNGTGGSFFGNVAHKPFVLLNNYYRDNTTSYAEESGGIARSFWDGGVSYSGSAYPDSGSDDYTPNELIRPSSPIGIIGREGFNTSTHRWPGGVTPREKTPFFGGGTDGL